MKVHQTIQCCVWISKYQVCDGKFVARSLCVLNMSADSGGPAYVFDNSSEDETIGVALLSAEEDDGDSGDGESNGGENNLEISAVHGLGKASSFSCTVNLANTVVSPPIHVPLLQHCTLTHSSVRMSRMVIQGRKKKGGI